MATKGSVFASLEGLPSALGAGEVYSAMEPVSKGVDLPASDSEREFKKKYDTDSMAVTTDGFTLFVSLDYAEAFEDAGGNGEVVGQRTPKTFFKFTIGESPTYSFFFGPDAPSYAMTALTVKKIIINKKKNEVAITLSEGKITIKNKKFRFSLADKEGTDGFMFQEAPKRGFPSMFVSVAPYNQKTVTLYKDALEQSAAAMMNAVKKMNEDGEGIYVWNADSATVYLSPQSFTFDSSLDKEFLLPPAYDYEDTDELDTKKSFIRFNCIIENASLRTNNYTGYDRDDPSILHTTIQFPGDEGLLAPMGTSDEGTETACGLESAEGRVLKSIKPVIAGATVQQVKLEFHDGSFCIFPDAETGLFTATDKETGQELQGRVEGLIIAEGSWKEYHTKEMINRIARNTNSSITLENSAGESLTSAIAWRTSNPPTIKVIVPTDEGSKLITISLEG
tara:strand:- start:10 stop:1359 length:1350 start_codon:yes stop_codon:yes gene_type:complete